MFKVTDNSYVQWSLSKTGSNWYATGDNAQCTIHLGTGAGAVIINLPIGIDALNALANA